LFKSQIIQAQDEKRKGQEHFQRRNMEMKSAKQYCAECGQIISLIEEPKTKNGQVVCSKCFLKAPSDPQLDNTNAMLKKPPQTTSGFPADTQMDVLQAIHKEVKTIRRAVEQAALVIILILLLPFFIGRISSCTKNLQSQEQARQTRGQ
jgi:hypothetical protein